VTITASASFTVTVQTSNSTTIGPWDSIIDWTQLFACGIFASHDDYKAFVNELHTEEYRKDIFRGASIIPKSTEHSHRVMNQIIPGKRNFRGRQSRRL